jgi:hypothetical protein
MGCPEKAPPAATTWTTIPAGIVLPDAAVRFELSSVGEMSWMETSGWREDVTTVVMTKLTVP